MIGDLMKAELLIRSWVRTRVGYKEYQFGITAPTMSRPKSGVNDVFI